MKICSTCKAVKELSEFNKHVRKRDGLRNECRVCSKVANKKHYAANIETLRARGRVGSAEWRSKPGNSERNRIAAKKWYSDAGNRAVAKKRTRDWVAVNKERARQSVLDWQRNNRGVYNALIKAYKVQKRNAVPCWANHFLISEAYDLADRRTRLLGFKWHVDHVVPLQSPLVCGLHVEANLAVIPSSVNCSKGNRHWPNMP